MDKKIVGLLVILVALSSVVSCYATLWNVNSARIPEFALNAQQQTTQPTSQTSILVDGAFALYPLMVTWAQQYEATNPNVNIQVSAGGAGKGMSDVLAGQVDIGMVSRAASQVEINSGAYPIRVARAGAVLIVNSQNPVLTSLLTQGLSKPVLQGVFIYGNVTNWGQAVNDPLSPVDKIDVYTRSDSSGLADTWAKFLGKTQDDLQGVGVYGDPGMIQAVQSDPIGIGYANLAFAYDNSTGKQVNGITVIPIDYNNNGKINGSENFYGNLTSVDNAIATGAFPTPPAMDLFLVTKGPPTGATLAFIIWILTDGQQYVPKAGLVTLTSSAISQELSELQTTTTSTASVTSSDHIQVPEFSNLEIVALTAVGASLYIAHATQKMKL
jgi:phosphate transport system substrate-binding protein